jgi:death-on-curing protein
MTRYMSLATALELIKTVGFHVRDVGLLNSALVRPKTTVFGADAYPEFPIKVAALMHSVIKNHPLIDGNKRTSWILMSAFLQLNDFQHNMDTETGFDLTLGIAEDRYTLEQAAEILGRHLVPLEK